MNSNGIIGYLISQKHCVYFVNICNILTYPLQWSLSYILYLQIFFNIIENCVAKSLLEASQSFMAVGPDLWRDGPLGYVTDNATGVSLWLLNCRELVAN